MIETWKTIKGFEDYEVSNLGRVKSYKFNRETLMTPSDNGAGYLCVNLSNLPKKSTKYVHKLVAVAFLDHVPRGLEVQVLHINNVRHDNKANNLHFVNKNLKKCHAK